MMVQIFDLQTGNTHMDFSQYELPDNLLNRRVFAQSCIAKALVDKNDPSSDWHSIYKATYPESFYRIEKANVSNVDQDDVVGSEPELAVMDIVVKKSAAGDMLPFSWRLDFRQPHSAAPLGVGSAWRGESRPFPVTRSSITEDALIRTSLGGIMVWTERALRHRNAPMMFQRALEESCARDIDFAMFNRDSGVEGETPAALNNDVETIPADSDPLKAFRDLFQNFNGNLDSTVLVMSAERAARLAMRDESSFADLGVRGGTIAQIPVAITQNAETDSTGDSVTMVDASRVCIAFDSLQVRQSGEATVEMQDDFDSNAGTELVPLWQNDAVGLLVEQFINWKLLDKSCCRVLTGADW